MAEKTFWEKLFGFLFADSPQSSMRLGFILTILGGLGIMMSVAHYIDTFAHKGVEITHWTDMGVFLVGVGSIMTGAAWMKERQKKVEVEAEKNKPTEEVKKD